jgi:hypothetical protein
LGQIDGVKLPTIYKEAIGFALRLGVAECALRRDREDLSLSDFNYFQKMRAALYSFLQGLSTVSFALIAAIAPSANCVDTKRLCYNLALSY